MSLRSPTEDENAQFVMPAWIAGIQVRTDASGDIHVNLDSSSPCWNDANRGSLLEPTEVPPAVFPEENTKEYKVRLMVRKAHLYVTFASFAVNCPFL
jgi:hypothetical protein